MVNVLSAWTVPPGALPTLRPQQEPCDLGTHLCTGIASLDYLSHCSPSSHRTNLSPVLCLCLSKSLKSSKQVETYWISSISTFRILFLSLESKFQDVQLCLLLHWFESLEIQIKVMHLISVLLKCDRLSSDLDTKAILAKA